MNIYSWIHCINIWIYLDLFSALRLLLSDVEAVAALLKRFLALEELQKRRQQEYEAEYGDAEDEDSLDNGTDSDEADKLWSVWSVVLL